MADHEIVAVRPTRVYRALSGAGLLDRWNVKPSRKGRASSSFWRLTSTGIPISLTQKVSGIFYSICSVLNGAGRAIVH
jgi:putative transposase